MNSPSPYLSYRIGNNEQRFYFDQRDTVRIGRGDPASGLLMDLTLPHSIPGVGRHHATIRRQGTEWVLVDGSKDGPSKNGTYLDGARIVAPAPLCDGSQLLLGTFPIEFCQPRPSSSGESGSLKQVVDTPALDEIAPEISISMADLTVSRPAASGGSSIWRVNFDSDSSLRSGSNQTTRSLSLFSDLGKALQISQEVDEFLENIVTTLLLHVRAESVSVVGWIPERNEFPALTSRNDNLQAERRGVSRTLLNKAIKRGEAMLVIDPGADPNLGISSSIADVTSVIVAPLWQDQQIRGALYVDTKKGIQAFGQHELEIVSGIALFTAVGIDLFEQRKRLAREEKQRQRLTPFLGKEVVDRIVNGQEASMAMVVAPANVTVLFSDLRGFTTMSQHLSPKAVVDLLNGVFELLTQAVFQHHGTLDKFIGDGMMAFFGAPQRLDNHPLLAVPAGLQMLSAMAEFNRSRAPDQEIGIRIGINTGDVVAGDIGSAERKDYTVIGDTVNIASRLESGVAKPGQLVIGPDTYEAVKHAFDCEPLGLTPLKGRDPIETYRVLGPRSYTA